MAGSTEKRPVHQATAQKNCPRKNTVHKLASEPQHTSKKNQKEKKKLTDLLNNDFKKAEKDDVDTSHPASTDNSELDGNKYASMSTAALYKLSNELGNRVLVSLTKNAEFHDDDEEARKSDSDSDSASDIMEEKGAVDLAGQAGWELAGLLSGQFDKRAADSLVYSTLTEIIKTANDDADKTAAYLYSSPAQLKAVVELV